MAEFVLRHLKGKIKINENIVSLKKRGTDEISGEQREDRNEEMEERGEKEEKSSPVKSLQYRDRRKKFQEPQENSSSLSGNSNLVKKQKDSNKKLTKNKNDSKKNKGRRDSNTNGEIVKNILFGEQNKLEKIVDKKIQKIKDQASEKQSHSKFVHLIKERANVFSEKDKEKYMFELFNVSPNKKTKNITNSNFHSDNNFNVDKINSGYADSNSSNNLKKKVVSTKTIDLKRASKESSKFRLNAFVKSPSPMKKRKNSEEAINTNIKFINKMVRSPNSPERKDKKLSKVKKMEKQNTSSSIVPTESYNDTIIEFDKLDYNKNEEYSSSDNKKSGLEHNMVTNSNSNSSSLNINSAISEQNEKAKIGLEIKRSSDSKNKRFSSMNSKISKLNPYKENFEDLNKHNIDKHISPKRNSVYTGNIAKSNNGKVETKKTLYNSSRVIGNSKAEEKHSKNRLMKPNEEKERDLTKKRKQGTKDDSNKDYIFDLETKYNPKYKNFDTKQTLNLNRKLSQRQETILNSQKTLKGANAEKGFKNMKTMKRKSTIKGLIKRNSKLVAMDKNSSSLSFLGKNFMDIPDSNKGKLATGGIFKSFLSRRKVAEEDSSNFDLLKIAAKKQDNLNLEKINKQKGHDLKLTIYKTKRKNKYSDLSMDGAFHNKMRRMDSKGNLINYDVDMDEEEKKKFQEQLKQELKNKQLLDKYADADPGGEEKSEFKKFNYYDEQIHLEELLKQEMTIQHNEEYLERMRIINEFDIDQHIVDIESKEKKELLEHYKTKKTANDIEFRLSKYKIINGTNRTFYRKHREILDQEVKFAQYKPGINKGPQLSNY